MADEPSRRRRLRFSLRSLMVAVLLIGSVAMLWRVRWPWVLEATLETSCASFNEACFSTDSNYLALIGTLDLFGQEPNVQCWDCASHEKIFQVSGVRRLGVPAFTHHSRLVTIESESISIRNATTGKAERVLNTAVLSKRPLYFAISSPSGEFIAAVADGITSIWDIDAEKLLWREEIGDSKAFFSPDSKWVAIAPIENSAAIFDARSGKRRFVVQPANAAYGAAFSPDGKQLFTWNVLGSYAIYSVDNQSKLLYELTPARSDCPFMRAEFSPDGQLISTIEAGAVIRTWNAKTGALVATSATQAGSDCVAFAFSTDSRHLFTAFYSQSPLILDARTCELLFRFPEQNHVPCATLSADGRHVAIGADGGKIALWTKRRDEGISGFFWLPEFWLTVVFAFAMMWSLRRDCREAR